MKYVIWFFIIDAYGYFIHRAYHHFPFLWRFHAHHHRAFAFKFHPVEMALNWGLPYICTLYFFGWVFPTVALSVVLFESYRGHGGFRGVRVPRRIYTGWVTRGYHKQHHENPNVNYTQVTKLWDWLLGTELLRKTA